MRKKNREGRRNLRKGRKRGKRRRAERAENEEERGGKNADVDSFPFPLFFLIFVLRLCRAYFFYSFPLQAIVGVGCQQLKR